MGTPFDWNTIVEGPPEALGPAREGWAWIYGTGRPVYIGFERNMTDDWRAVVDRPLIVCLSPEDAHRLGISLVIAGEAMPQSIEQHGYDIPFEHTNDQPCEPDPRFKDPLAAQAGWFRVPARAGLFYGEIDDSDEADGMWLKLSLTPEDAAALGVSIAIVPNEWADELVEAGFACIFPCYRDSESSEGNPGAGRPSALDVLHALFEEQCRTKDGSASSNKPEPG